MNQVPCSGVTVIDRSAGAGILAVVRSITRIHHCRAKVILPERF
ncbi:hypothetical protein [Arthrobacter rhizosphaerae]|nr:hypothetical protein [Arthrobacter rhizosphaerae]